jgi:hypothetical protein
MQSKELGETPAPCNHRLDHSACCTAAHPVALCALQGSEPLPSWREPTSLARCAWGANWTVLMRCAADSALSKQQRRQFSATAAGAEYRIHPQPRRKSCNDLRFCDFCEGVTAYAATALDLRLRFALASALPRAPFVCLREQLGSPTDVAASLSVHRWCSYPRVCQESQS